MLRCFTAKLNRLDLLWWILVRALHFSNETPLNYGSMGNKGVVQTMHLNFD